MAVARGSSLATLCVMRTGERLGLRGLTLALVALACAHCGTTTGAAPRTKDDAGSDASADANAAVDPTGPGEGDGGPTNEAGGDATVIAGGNDSCTDATEIPLVGLNPRIDLVADLAGAKHDVDATCSPEQGADVFYKFTFSKRVFVYADTFGSSIDTVLFLLSSNCEPITTTLSGGDTCNDDGCGTKQSQLVALLEPGTYRLGLAGRGPSAGPATIHFEWALAGSGTATHLPSTDSVQSGTTTSADGNLAGLSNDCVAGGPENSYWWARCPSDPARTLRASTCGGAAFESVVEAQIPKSAPGLPSAYMCNVDGCGIQGTLGVVLPAGAGLGVLSVDGQAGSDFGPYTMNVTYTTP